jgi:hypothetical protein
MKKFLWSTLLIVIFLIGLFIYWFYYNVYSNGERKGLLVKITNKGNVFKTYEGEMWLSCRQLVNPEKFLFSIEDKVLADSLQNLQDQCVELEYKQYRKTIAWRGDSEYIIVGFKRIAN